MKRSVTKIPAVVLAIVLLMGLGFAANAAVVYTGGVYTENFDSIGAFGTAPPADWIVGAYSTVQNRVPPASAPVNTGLTVDDGSNDTKGISYNYGTASAAERAVGGIATTGTGDRAIQVAITNSTGSTIEALDISYTLEQWRDYQGASSSGTEGYEFWFSTAPGSDFTELPQLETFAPINTGTNSALDGNLPANQDSVSALVALPGGGVADGSTFYLTWHDWNEDGTSDHGIAIDDFSFAAAAPPAFVHLEIPIITGNDDAEESLVDFSMDLGSSDLELCNDGPPDPQVIGLRFQSIDIGPGLEINSASIQFTVDETDDEVTSVRIVGELTPNAAEFSGGSSNITSRTTTSNFVVWADIPLWSVEGAAGADQRTPDLTSIIQEIVNQPGWASGNSLAIGILPEPIDNIIGERTAESYDGSPSQAPVLIIDYTPRPETVAAGGFGLDWHTPAAWDNGVPDSTKRAIVDGATYGSTVMTVSADAQASCFNLGL